VNEGTLDRLVRLLLAVVAIIVAIYTTGIIQILLIVVAGILWGTAASGVCLLYLPFGVNTCKQR
jgi:Protein of unknown function (DUF2892)